MKNRYVLDGAPGSGKSTVLFGMSDGDVAFASMHTMVGLGYACVHEAVAEAHAALSRQGIDFFENQALWLETIVEIDISKYERAGEGVTFYDRCFHHWKIFSEAAKIPLPEWYNELNSQIRYDNPVFVVAPVKSMDLNRQDIHPSRRFTWEQRLSMHKATVQTYEELGYEVVEVPMYSEGDIEDNNRKRIRDILNHLGL